MSIIDPNRDDPIARAEFFLTRTIKKTNGCLVWQGACNGDGYGEAQVCGKVWRVHRAVYNFLVEEIPVGIQVLHTCDNPPCINPDHLFLGTESDNMKDMTSKGRGKHHGRKTLSEREKELISFRMMNGISRKEVASEFGVSPGHVSRVAIDKGVRRYKSRSGLEKTFPRCSKRPNTRFFPSDLVAARF